MRASIGRQTIVERGVYKPLPMARMHEGVVVQPLLTGPKLIRLDSPAIEAMTDLRQVAAVTIRGSARISEANRTMIARGVRLLFVVAVTGVVEGLLTAHDIVGEKAVNLLHERGGRHTELTVADLMLPHHAIEVLDIDQVLRSEVGHIITTLKDSNRQHALVVDRDRLTREEYVRGIFSATQIGRQLGVPIATFDVAHTFAEIEAELAR
jgi:CBS domain-containing protein